MMLSVPVGRGGGGLGCCAPEGEGLGVEGGSAQVEGYHAGGGSEADGVHYTTVKVMVSITI